MPVTPLAGVWIEIVRRYRLPSRRVVTPLAGVWIEIIECIFHPVIHQPSHPSRVCGLKLFCLLGDNVYDDVTPLAGVWIEICVTRMSHS